MQSDLFILIFGFSDRLGLPRWLSGKESICLPMQEMQIRSLGQEDSLEEEMATTPVSLLG